ncbi:uncharacterized protein CMU_006650 [Cryptosporidium muris RN66]|uniref:U3 small nucleolar RNA-associated protein 25 n=1 Tax=Cryptosporidium muris (strain RN66) TaxID=441375 RepID=B6AHP7_CRYMR|nr:uncharacterized protein CMU_006650 [Cryptosporidium muris RN66]EEA07742.1 hypothetical protein, conserved [Cryptosporidium muris RN66]|eukprot:XP_002142091.1 hypothetical protein [Cryptosporidium muris RN66]
MKNNHRNKDKLSKKFNSDTRKRRILDNREIDKFTHEECKGGTSLKRCRDRKGISRYLQSNDRILKSNILSDSTISDIDEPLSSTEDIFSNWLSMINVCSEEPILNKTKVKNLKLNPKSEELFSKDLQDCTLKDGIVCDNSVDKSDYTSKTESHVENNTNISNLTQNYFNDYTNFGMISLQSIESKFNFSNDLVIVHPQGFSPFRSPFSRKSHRMNDIEKFTTADISQKTVCLDYFGIEGQIISNWKTLTQDFPLHTRDNIVVELQSLFRYINGYIDIEYCDPDCILSPWIVSLVMLHISNHISCIRKLVLSNNSVLKKYIKNNESSFKGITHNIDHLGDDNLRDQGFHRCRILILSPFRGTAKRCVDILIKLLPQGKRAKYLDRFNKEFGDPELESQNDEAEKVGIVRDDPLYRYLFVNSNHDDDYRVGIQVSKSGILFYSPFDQSDIILASPLGLRRIIGTRGESDTKREYGFLSSVEICLIYGADIILMQNWEHLLDIFDVLNKLPSKNLGSCDIRRIYQPFIDGNSKIMRQTILIASGRSEDFTCLFRKYTNNCRGYVRLWNSLERLRKLSNINKFELPLNIAASLVPDLKQMFIKVSNQIDSEESMLSYMSSYLYPDILAAIDGINQRVLLVLPNYISYLRIRKYLIQQSAVFGSCHESSSNSSLSKNRLAFYKGELPILITTERFLFFRRYLLKGATTVIFWGPPIFPVIYVDCIYSLNFPCIDKSKNKTRDPLSIVLFHELNSLALERIVGTKKCSYLLTRSKINRPTIIIGDS